MRIGRISLATCVLLTSSVALAQQPADPPRATQPPLEGGFWPTPRMLERILDRISEDMAERYSFDDDQSESARQIMKDKLPKWLTENRAEIQHLTNEWMEALLNGEPPTVEQVQQWSQRTLPLISEFKTLVMDWTGEMSNIMTDDQRVILEGEMAAFQTGMTFVTNKVGVWAEGGFDPETEWPSNPKERDRQRRMQDKQLKAEMKAAQAEAEATARAGGSAGATPPTNTKPEQPAPARRLSKAGKDDDWARYVDDFIRRYELNEEQKTKALGFLATAREDRESYFRKKAEQIEKADKAMKDAKTPEERQKAKTALDKQYEPVTRIFQRMKDRLDDLPTKAQRKKAAQTETQRAATDAAGKTSASAGKTGAVTPPVVEKPADGASPTPPVRPSDE